APLERPPTAPPFPYTPLFRSDDHTLLLQALTTALAGCGMTVEATATSPEEAVHAVALHDPDLLLTDLCFPGGSGLDAARKAQVRSEEHTSELQSRENLVCRLL